MFVITRICIVFLFRLGSLNHFCCCGAFLSFNVLLESDLLSVNEGYTGRLLYYGAHD